MAKPAVVLVGADKGGVGKTTVSRALLDYFAAHNIATRAFDTETPKGTLKRFHPNITEVVDMTSTSDQMKIFDTLATAEPMVTVIDIRARHAARRRWRRCATSASSTPPPRPQLTFHGFPYPRPVDRLAGGDRRDGNIRRRRALFPGEELHQQHVVLRVGPGDLQFVLQARSRNAHDITIPKLNEMACEQVELRRRCPT